MTKINNGVIIEGTNFKLGDIPNLITTRNVYISNISIPSKSTIYAQYTIPIIDGYTPIAVAVNAINGASSGYTIVMTALDGWMALNNGASVDVTIGVNLKIIYLKN